VFEVKLEDGTTIEVDKHYEGDDIVLKDADGKRYAMAPSGQYAVPLAPGETPAPEQEADTEPVPEETPNEDEPAGEEETGGSDEDGAEGGANEEPVG
jgi:hypothetical protein